MTRFKRSIAVVAIGAAAFVAPMLAVGSRAAAAGSGKTVRASVGSHGVQGNGASSTPSISGNGRFVAFSSDASNLVAHDANHARDIFVRDLVGGSTRLVSVSSAGLEGNADS